MDFEPRFKVYNLISIRPESMKLGQMTNLKVPLTPKFFITRQKSPFCSDHIGEKIIVVRFFLDFL